MLCIPVQIKDTTPRVSAALISGTPVMSSVNFDKLPCLRLAVGMAGFSALVCATKAYFGHRPSARSFCLQGHG